MRQKLFDIVKAVVDADARTAALTPGQRDHIANAITDLDVFDTPRDQGWAFPSPTEVTWKINTILMDRPEVARPVPEPNQIANALAKAWTAKHGDCDPMQKIVWLRQATAASPDERLQMSEGLELEPAPEAAKDTVRSADELDTEVARRRGQSLDEYRRTTWEADRRRYRHAVEAEDRQQEAERKPLVVDDAFMRRDPMSRIVAARGSNGVVIDQTTKVGDKIDPHSPKFQALSPGERINRWRAQEAARRK